MTEKQTIERPDYYRAVLSAPGERQLDRYLHSDIIHSMPAKTPISTLVANPVSIPLPDTITIGVSHAIT